MGGRYSCMIHQLTSANLSALQMSIAHIIKRYLLTYLRTVRRDILDRYMALPRQHSVAR